MSDMGFRFWLHVHDAIADSRTKDFVVLSCLPNRNTAEDIVDGISDIIFSMSVFQVLK